MKQVCLLLAFFFSVYTARADYEPTYLPGLITKSNLIVRGIIRQVMPSSIRVAIQSVYKGKITDSLVTIEKFKNWTCAQRFGAYATGQEALFFLDNKNGIYKITGAGNEGEIPVVNGKAYYKQVYLNIDKDAHEYPIYTGNISGFTYKLSDFEQAITYYEKHSDAIRDAVKTNPAYNLKHMKNAVLNRIIAELKQ
jgi:hypothetical protein